ncbi:PQ-loop repeat-containing protein [Sporobolomyces salmoneus]|uniref:PQ-loop repeat-containing protein n=1 Tax=Sporobolomyces salmoneus TaxID=183962 RepID=UPI00317EF21A
MFDQGTLSSTLGALSIVTWLGAQSPQIYENYKNESVEGLALPFLISWFWGDFTNFVGCVLTHQLPFQTYLATYFLFVDVALVSQYYYYSLRKPPQDLPPLSEAFPYAQGPGPHHPPPYVHPRKASSSKSRQFSHSQRRPSRSSRRSTSYLHHAPQLSPTQGREREREEDEMVQSWMSEPPGTATSTRSTPNLGGGGTGRLRQTSSNVSYSVNGGGSSTSLYTQMGEPPSPTIPERGRTLARSAIPAGGGGGGVHGSGSGFHTTFDPTLATIYGSPSVSVVPGGGDYLMHTSQTRLPHHHVSFGSNLTINTQNSTTMTRPNDESRHYTPPPTPRQHQHAQEMSRASSSRSRPPGPNRTGIAFLSVGLLFTFGNQLQSTGGGESLLKREGGEAWSTKLSTETVSSRQNPDNRWNQLRHPSFFVDSSSTTTTIPLLSKRSTFPLDVSIIDSAPSPRSSSSTNNDPPTPEDDEEEVPRKEGPDWERIIGRMSAWLCTTLYLTSRLPQIWRNFRRRSVEGLAMTLFFFAFIGNSLYVVSILTNPLAQTEPGYIVESTPYLLGSGGTLCFDLMIMFQSVIYSEKRKGRRSRKLLGEEEEAGLLDGEEGTDGEDRESERTARGAGGGRRSRDSSRSFGYGRSISSGRRSASRKSSSMRRNGESLSMTMSRSSTDVMGGGGERGVSNCRLEEDRQFDWGEQTATGGDGLRRNDSNSSSTMSMAGRGVEETILEAGESSVTVR